MVVMIEHSVESTMYTQYRLTITPLCTTTSARIVEFVRQPTDRSHPR